MMGFDKIAAKGAALALDMVWEGVNVSEEVRKVSQQAALLKERLAEGERAARDVRRERPDMATSDSMRVLEEVMTHVRGYVLKFEGAGIFVRSQHRDKMTTSLMYLHELLNRSLHHLEENLSRPPRRGILKKSASAGASLGFTSPAQGSGHPGYDALSHNTLLNAGQSEQTRIISRSFQHLPPPPMLMPQTPRLPAPPTQNFFPGGPRASHPSDHSFYPNGQVVYRNGQASYPNGQALPPIQQAVFPNGQVLHPNGHALLPNGQVVYPNEQAVFPNGQVLYPNGQIPFPNGQAPFPSGQAPFPNGQAPFPNGQAPFPNGQGMHPNGQALHPSGYAYFPNSQVYFSNGQAFHTSVRGYHMAW